MIGRARMRLGHAFMVLGARINVGLMDLGLIVQPRRLRTFEPGDKPTPWLGLIVVIILLLGLLAAGDIGLVLLREALPTRSGRP